MLDNLPKELQPYKDIIKSSEKECIKIKIVPTKEATELKSNACGYPYLPLDFEYPTNTKGETLNFLAQINFAELPENDSYPKEGILQFYIGTDSGFGMDFDFKNPEKNYQTIFHSSVNTEYQTDFAFLDALRKEAESPFQGLEKQFVMQFEKKNEYVGARDYHFNEYFGGYPYELFQKFKEKEYELHDYYLKTFDNAGHKLGGYAFFTQEDPRLFSEPVKDHELLFQLDTDSGILWGDMGISNFFISKEDLKNRNFSNVIFNWDCH